MSEVREVAVMIYVLSDGTREVGTEVDGVPFGRRWGPFNEEEADAMAKLVLEKVRLIKQRLMQ